MKKIIYVVRTNMSFLNILGLFGCINWKVALRKKFQLYLCQRYVLCYSYYILNMSLSIHLSGVRVQYSQSGPWYTSMNYSQCKSSIKMLWTKFYNSIKMRFNRRTSLFIFFNHCILLNCGKAKNKRKGTIQRHMQHWTQGTQRRQIK